MTRSIDRFISQKNEDHSATKLERVLQDIVQNIAIKSDFTITHPEYDPIMLPPELRQRFEYLSDKVKNDYLLVKLQQFLYHNYYSQVTGGDRVKENDRLENRSVKWSDSDFLRQLRRNNHSDGHFEEGWSIVGETAEGFLQVKKDGLTLHIRSDRHLREVDRAAKIGDVVAVKMPPQLVEPKFYISVGTVGSIDRLDSETDTQIVDIYFNLSSDGALVLMDRLTDLLNPIEIPFNFKVLYSREDYIYNETAILSFKHQDYDRVAPIVATLYQENKAYFRPDTPLFTKFLALGLSLAEKPKSQQPLLNFGQSRCRIIAQGLIKAWQAGEESNEGKLKYIRDRFSEAGIDLDRPYLNPNSQDIY